MFFCLFTLTAKKAFFGSFVVYFCFYLLLLSLFVSIFLSKKDKQILKALKITDLEEIVTELNLLLEIQTKFSLPYETDSLHLADLQSKIFSPLEWQKVQTICRLTEKTTLDQKKINLLKEKINQKIASLKEQIRRRIVKAWHSYQKRGFTKTEEKELEEKLQKLSTKDLCQHYQIKLCEGICGGLESLKDYKSKIRQIEKVLNGQTESIEKILTQKMKQAVGKKDFRLAAIYRDRLALLERIKQKQIVVLPTAEDLDLLTVIVQKQAEDFVYLASFFLQQIRHGRLVNVQNFFLSGNEVDFLSEENLQKAEPQTIILSFLKTFWLGYNFVSGKPIILEAFFVD